MVPFGQNLVLWRLKRGLTQAALALAAGLPRPNLSDIERGKREVTLSTLRSLAAALGVRPGLLADGLPPSSPNPSMSRGTLERIAESAVHGIPLSNPQERGLAKDVRSVYGEALGVRPSRRGARAGERAWLRLSSGVPAVELRSLQDRVRKRLRVP